MWRRDSTGTPSKMCSPLLGRANRIIVVSKHRCAQWSLASFFLVIAVEKEGQTFGLFDTRLVVQIQS